MSPSQASETCASASSATSARCRVGHYANACGGCQECLSPMTPGSIVIEIAITTAASATKDVSVAVASITSEDSNRQSSTTIRSPTIQTTVTRVVAVNKLSTLLIEMRDSSTASLAHGIRRRNRYQKTYYQNS